jgi:hypothetical protein
MAELRAAKKPNHKEHDQNEPDGPASAASPVAIIPIVATPTAEQEDQQNYDENCAHDPPTYQMLIAARIGRLLILQRVSYRVLDASDCILDLAFRLICPTI